MKTAPKIYITEPDYKRISEYLDSTRFEPRFDALEEELNRAEVIPLHSAPENIVTLGSTVTFLDMTTGQRREVTVVQPNHADASKGMVSVLAPVGAALIGLAEGKTIAWEMPDGKKHKLKILSVAKESRATPTLDVAA